MFPNWHSSWERGLSTIPIACPMNIVCQAIHHFEPESSCHRQKSIWSFSKRSRDGQHPLILLSVITFLEKEKCRREEGKPNSVLPAIARLLDTRLKKDVLCCLKVMFILDRLVLAMRQQFYGLRQRRSIVQLDRCSERQTVAAPLSW